MPNIMNEGNQLKGYPVACEPCEKYEDKSVYFDDATTFLSAIDMRKVKNIIASQMNVVGNAANSSDVTVSEFYDEVCKLKNIVQNYVVLDRLNSK